MHTLPSSPSQGELVVYKPGKGAFYATDLEQQLRRSGITHLLFAGVTTEVCGRVAMTELCFAIRINSFLLSDSVSHL